MSGRDERIYEEAAALWRELFSEPPPVREDGLAMLEAIMKRIPDTPYERIASPFLRPSQINGPRHLASRS
jgi:hypothetical protein